MNTFDAYHKWLGIAPDDQPPNHYRLLGLPLFESDEEVIQAATDRQMRHIHSYQNGPRGQLSQQLLCEISEAGACLLDAARKADYDAKLSAACKAKLPPVAPRKSQQGPPANELPSGKEARGETEFLGIVIRDPAPPAGKHTKTKNRRSTKGKLSFSRAQRVAFAVVAAALLLLSIIWLWPTSNSQPEPGVVVFDWTPEELRYVTVAINDQPVLPLDIRQAEFEAPAGRISLVAKRRYFQPIVETLDLAPGSRRVIQAKWRPLASLSVRWPSTGQADAEVMLDGKQLDSAAIIRSTPQQLDLALEPGPHRIALQRDGFEPRLEAISLRPGARHQLHFKLVPIRAEKVTDLLKLIDAKKHVIGERWKRSRGKLEVDSAFMPACVTPYQPGRNFRLLVEFERSAGSGGLAVVVPSPRGSGKTFTYAIGGRKFSSGKRHVFELVRSGSKDNGSKDNGSKDNGSKENGSKDIVSLDKRPRSEWLPSSDSRVASAVPHSDLIAGCPIVQFGPGRFVIHRMQIIEEGDIGQSQHLDLNRVLSFEGHSYQRFNQQLTWREAEAYCRARGGYLCCLESEEEQRFLLANLHLQRTTWLGAADEIREGNWRWLSGEKWNWTNWDAHKPATQPELPYHHLVAGTSGRWSDRAEGERHAFVCEWSSSPPSKSRSVRFFPMISPKSVGRAITRNGRTYALIDSPQTWHVAKFICEGMSGQLCCTETEEEADFITQMLPESSIWLGASDPEDDKKWLWASGAPVGYTRWNGKIKTRNPQLTNYLEVLGKRHGDQAGKWLAQNGSMRRPFICEWSTTNVPLLAALKKKKSNRKLPQDLTAARAVLEKELQDQVASRRSRASLAAAWIERAENEKREALAAAMLEQAAVLAAKLGHTALAMHAIDQMQESFHVNDSWQRRFDLINLAVTKIKTESELREFVDACRQLCEVCEDEEILSNLEKVYNRIPKSASLAKNSSLLTNMNRDRDYFREVVQLAKRATQARVELSVDKESPQANLQVGTQLALIRRDWPAALVHLSKASGGFAKHAQTLIANPNDFDAQMGLADAWWSSASKQTGKRNSVKSELERNAAKHWYRQAVNRAADKDLDRIMARLRPDLPAAAKHSRLDLPLLTNAESVWLTPEKSQPLHANSNAGFLGIEGSCDITYPVTPLTSFVHELEFQMFGDAGKLEFKYHRKEGGVLKFFWNSDEQAFRYELAYYNHLGLYPNSAPGFKPGETMKVTVYSRPGLQALYMNGQRLRSSGRPAEDLRFRILSGKKCRAKIHHCLIRPWNAADYAAIGEAAPPELGGRPGVAARAVLKSQRDLPLRPKLGAPSGFVVHDTSIEMNWLPAGAFTRRFGMNGPTSEVKISKGLWLGKYELSQRDWDAIAGSNPSRWRSSTWLPTAGVSYLQVAEFCRALSERERKAGRLPSGYVYRLPTEAEWEYACLAGKDSRYTVDAAQFWHRATARQPREIGLSPANPWGFHDLHGNLSEWTLDGHSEFPKLPPARQVDPFVRPLPAGDKFCVRGGAWWQSRDRCTSKSRIRREGNAASSRGFRLALAPRLADSPDLAWRR